MEWRKKFALGDVMIVRYADDFVLGFQHRKEAERFREQWQERLRAYGLELHPDKTRLIQFGRYAAEHRQRDGQLKAIKAALRRRLHEPIKDIGEWLRAVVRGYFNYHAVPGTFPGCGRFGTM